MVDIKGRATEKIGPLPVYGWVLILGVLFIGVYEYRKLTNGATTKNAADNTTVDTTASNVDSAQLQAVAVGEEDLQNQLAQNTGEMTRLATNVGKNTTATQTNTHAERGNTGATNRDTRTDRHEVVSTKHKPVQRHLPKATGRHHVHRHRHKG